MAKKKTKKTALDRLAIVRLAIILLATIYGEYQLWQAYRDTPFEPLPLSPFVAFGLAINILFYNSLLKRKPN